MERDAKLEQPFAGLRLAIPLLVLVLGGCIWGSARPPIEHYIVEQHDLPFQVRGSFQQLFPDSSIRSAMSVVRTNEPLQYKVLFQSPRGELRTARFSPEGELLAGD